MSETLEITVAIIALIAVFLFTRNVHAWRIRRAYRSIIQDLKALGALDPGSAVQLPYARHRMWNMGARDYRPKALEHLIMTEVVGSTGTDRFYLKNPAIAERQVS